MKILGANFSGKASTEVILFTVVEIVTLTVWLAVLFPDTLKSPHALLAIIVLGIGLLVEHFISAATGVNVTKA